jgi:hypothetical protein
MRSASATISSSSGGEEVDTHPAVELPLGLELHALAYNPGNFIGTRTMPAAAEPWSLTSLREKLIKIGAKVVSHGRYVTFRMAEIAVSRQMFADILILIARLRAPPAPA